MSRRQCNICNVEADGAGGADSSGLISGASFNVYVNYSYSQSLKVVYYLLIIIIFSYNVAPFSRGF